MNCKNTLVLAVTSALFMLSGCSSKQYFEPEKTYSASSVSHSYGEKIIDLSRDGATLENRRYIGKSGLSTINLGEGYRFLSESATYVLAGNTEGILKIIDKNTKETVRAVALHIPIVSATIKNGVIAYVLNNNTYGVYQVSGNRKVVERASKRTFAIDTRAASPIFVGNNAVMPMLDGKFIIVNSKDTDNVKIVYLSNDKVFNNIVYLVQIGSKILAATPKKLILVNNGKINEYRANISEISVSNGFIYLFTKEGTIVKLDNALKVQKTKKFTFAHFSASTSFNGKVYALDQKGSLIVLNSNLDSYKIYDIGEVDSPAFIAGTKLYKDGDIIELSQLGYE